jgi:hypothetical protein
VLYLANGDFAQQAAKDLAKRLASETTNSAAAKVDYGYQLVLARKPSPQERDLALSYLRDGGITQLEGFSWMLLNLSEFIFLP